MYCSKKEKMRVVQTTNDDIFLIRMWLLVVTLALLGNFCAAEDISGCCTHLAVTRWAMVILVVMVFNKR